MPPRQRDTSYPSALAHLTLLQSNRAVTALFTAPVPAGDTGTDLNALALPEMLAWLARAGYDPASLAAAGLRCVHVAGTKGKGSVGALVASVLGRYGSGRVGLYTSPHVVGVRERIVVDGRAVGEEVFARYFFEVWDRLSEAARERGEGEPEGPGTKPFYFRFLTILALHVFVREGVRDVVVECGIGGEYDATNVLPAEVVSAAVVTQLGIDHVAMLGDTVEKIAWNKAGIFKKGVKAFTRRLDHQEGVMKVLRERAAEKGATLVEIGDEEVERWEGVKGAKLEGPFQKYNMALAVAAAREHLIKGGFKLEGEFGREGYALSSIPEKFETGLREASLRGRCEIFKDEDGIEWFIDGAHTEDSLAGVGQWFAGKTTDDDGVRILVFNQQERDPAMLLAALLSATEHVAHTVPVFTHAIFTRNEEQEPIEGEPTRDLTVQITAKDTLQSFGGDTEAYIQNAVQLSVEQIRSLAVQARKNGKSCKVLVTGSFHLIGAVVKTIDHVEY
ncbi:Mur ligase [Lasiosphaeria hispida]|uniref:Folylpolyglutamate synthase n=1 Tax=Lasiosphaeria hispida TaxID=260671 RepID=A0AAJ0H7J1_9PEZI|nr:Mur ligase [Lasiosphaeria hispida]